MINLNDYKQQLQTTRKSEENLKIEIEKFKTQIQEKDEQLQLNQERLMSLQARLNENENQLFDFQNQVETLTEKESLIGKLKQQLRENLNERSQLERRVEASEIAAAEAKSFSEAYLSELEQKRNATEELANLKLNFREAEESLVEKTLMINRLKQDIQVLIDKSATKTAMAATLEQEIKQLKDTIDQMTKEKINSKNQLIQLQDTNAKLQIEIANKLQQITDLENENGKKVTELTNENQTEIEKIKAKYDDEMKQMKADFSKRSSLAQQLVMEKDELLKKLNAKAEALQQEIDCGGHSERKIMELAQAQARREFSIATELGTRDMTMKQLQQRITEQEAQLAAAANDRNSLQQQVIALKRMHKREGVNMEYLKNIIVQFMSFPDNSSERKSLIPVISTLLQFTPEDDRIIQESQTLLSWFGAKPVKQIFPDKSF